MKKAVILLLLSGAFISSAIAQDSEKKKNNTIKEGEVPAGVVTKFKELYPKAEDMKWETEAGNFEVEFESDEKKMSVLFSPQGEVIETETEIRFFQLPEPAQEYIKVTYPGKKVDETSRIVAANGTVTYEAEIKKKDLVFDSSGIFITEKMD